MPTTIAELAAQLVSAHDGGPLIETVPENLVPKTKEEIQALQTAIANHVGELGGWKIVAGQDEPLCAPVPANRYFENGATLDTARHRFIISEIEVAVKLKADLPAGSDLAAAEAAIESIHPVIEMIGNPFVDRAAQSKDLLLGDLQSNGAIVVGPAVDNGIRAELATLPVSLSYDGAVAHSVEKGANWEDILKALSWLSTHAEGRGLGLKAGHVIITGARALLARGEAKAVEGQLGSWGKVNCTITG